MAATVVANLTALDPNLADATTGWVGASGGLDDQVYQQGTGSFTYQTPKNGVGNGNFTPAAAVDMSVAGTHIYWIMRCDVMPFCELKTTGTVNPSGLMLKVESAGGSKTWHIAGSDTWGGEFKSFVADLANTSELFETVGALDLTAVTVVSWLTDNSNSGTIRIIDNTWLDAPRYGTGLTAYGADFGYADIEAIDQATANKYGVIEFVDGNLIVRGGITIDDNGGTTTFNSTGEDITFADIPVGADLYKLDFTGAGTTAVINTLSAKSYGADVNTRFDFDASGTVGSFTMSGSSLNRAAISTFKLGQSISGTKFNNCYQVRPDTSTFSGNAIASTADVAGGLLWAESSAVSGVDFTTNVTGAGIEHSLSVGSPYDYTDLTFSGNTFDANNTSGAAITVNNTGLSDASTSTGSAVTFLSAATLSMTVKDEDGVAISGAYAYIDDNNVVPFIMNTTTSVAGLASVGHTAGAVVGATWRVRKYGFKAYKAISDVPASGVKDIPVTLINDPQQV